mgnify:CR=1 FL=1
MRDMRTAEIMVAVCSAALIVGACKGKDKDAGGGVVSKITE